MQTMSICGPSALVGAAAVSMVELCLWQSQQHTGPHGIPLVTCPLFCIMAMPISIPPTQYKDSLWFTPFRHLLCSVLAGAIQTGVRQCLSMVLICIPLKISDVQPFLTPVGHFVSTLGENLFRFFAPFCFFIKFWGLLFVFLFSCMSPLCILHIKPI